LTDHPLFAWSSRDDVRVKFTKQTGKLDVTVSPDSVPGICWIRVYNAEGVSAQRPFVIGTLPDVREQEPNNELSKAQLVETLPAVVNGVLSSGREVDTFAVALKTGQTFVASMTAHETLGSPMDAVLQIVSPEGFVLEQNNDHAGLDPQIAFVAPADGIYRIRTFALASKPNASITFQGSSSYIYRLTLTTAAFADHAWPLAQTRTSNEPVPLRGWNVEDGFAALRLDSNELPVSSALLWHPQLANMKQLRIVTSKSVVEQESDQPAAHQSIELPVAVSGRIDQSGDGDSYEFTGKKGQKLIFRVEARSLGSPLDPVLKLSDTTGKLIKEVDDPSRGVFDSVLSATIPADGQYRISVTDLYGSGGFRFVYLLSAGVEQPEYAITLAADAFTLAADKPLEIPVTVNRVAGFAEELEVTAVERPPGVTVKPAKSAKDGDTAKTVKLIFEASGDAVRPGPFRVVAKAAGSTNWQTRATAAISGLTAKTDRFWLTLPNTKLDEIPVSAEKPGH
jgi:hypothetical protein